MTHSPKPYLDRSYTWAYALLTAVFFLPAFVDLAIGIEVQVTQIGIPIGPLYRIPLLCIMLGMLYMSRQVFLKSYVGISIGLWLIALCAWVVFKPQLNLEMELNHFIRWLILPSCIGMLVYLSERFYLSFDKLLAFVQAMGTCIALSIVVSAMLNIGYHTYPAADLGYISFYLAQNDVGLALSLCLAIALLRYARQAKHWHVLTVLIHLVAMVLLGTRTALLCAFIIPMVAMCSFALLRPKGWQVSKTTLLASWCLFFAVAVLAGYQYWQMAQANPYLADRFTDLAVNGLNVRGELIEAAQYRLDQRPWIFNVFGDGVYDFSLVTANKMYAAVHGIYVRYVEHDYYDFIGAYGYGLGLFMLLLPLVLWMKAMYQLVIGWNLMDVFCAMSISLFMLHSLTSGHALKSPLVAPIAAVWFYWVLHHRYYTTQQSLI